MINRIIVIAGNYTQFTNWLYKNKLNTKNFIYISSINTLRGLSNLVPYIMIGEYWEHKYYKEIISHLEFMGNRKISPEQAIEKYQLIFLNK